MSSPTVETTAANQDSQTEQSLVTATTINPEPQIDTAIASSHKRKDAPSEEENDSKRRQLTPPGANGHHDAVENGGNQTQNDTEVEAPEAPAHENSQMPTYPPLPAHDVKLHAELNVLSRQLLKTFTHTTFEWLTQVVSRPKSIKGHEYIALYGEFKLRRAMFPTVDNFIGVVHTDGILGNDAFVRRLNTVTFAASMMGSRDASFRQLDLHFLETFVGRTGRFLPEHAEILLGLKTQAYISQAVEKGCLREDILNDLFPLDVASKLLESKPKSSNGILTDSEQAFASQLLNRRRELSEKTTPAAIRALRDRHRWNEVLTNMIRYMRENFVYLTEVPADQIQALNHNGEHASDLVDQISPRPPNAKLPLNTGQQTAQGMQASYRNSAHQNPPQSLGSTLQQAQTSTTNIVNAQSAGGSTASAGNTDPVDMDFDLAQVLSQAADNAADVVLREFQQDGSLSSFQQAPATSSAPTSQIPYQYHLPAGHTAQIPPQYALPTSQGQYAGQGSSSAYAHAVSPSPVQSHATNPPGSPGAHPGGQSQPTHQLYELARQATNNRTTQPAARRPGTQSQRRPWTNDEEQALMQGLDQVKGPHWSMILQLYGAGGKINEVLKDRNQVQLKDKARNLKLWFLKSGVEVPVSLRSVTGELKTRAPAAVRNAHAHAAVTGCHPSQAQQMPSTYSPQNYTPYAAATQGVYAANTPPVSSAAPGMNTGYTSAGSQDPNVTMDQDQFGNDNDEAWYKTADDAAAQAADDLQKLLGGIMDTEGDGASNDPLGINGVGEATNVKSETPAVADSQPQAGTEETTVPAATEPASVEVKVETAPTTGEDTSTLVNPALDSGKDTEGHATDVAIAGDVDIAIDLPDFDEDAIARAAEEAAALAAQDLSALT